MLDQARLLSRIEVLGNEAAAWGGALHAELGEPASPAMIAECESRIGTALPGELASLLRRMNGLTVYFYEKERTAALMSYAWSAKLQIFDTNLIATFTLGIREFFDDIALGPRAPSGARERSSAILALSSEADVVTYLPLDRADAAGNCPVMEFNQEYYSDWLSEPLPDPIAVSIEQHVWKSLDSLSRTRRTFMYWVRLSD